MTEEELKAIEERANAATPGPWSVEYKNAHGPEIGSYRYAVGIHPALEDWQTPTTEDSEFIAHAREDVPKLVAEVRRLRHEKMTLAWLLREHHERGEHPGGDTLELRTEQALWEIFGDEITHAKTQP